ncbi:hypothetical protein [Streptococcus cristatus]|uniref:Uncharacterized protein n=1 Tax=Streptococcus cristatus TaxID=45634 RepID=A0A3R9HCF0_STRCR|nr:hypothetical protein [Streptococcus cristatus]RSI40641.1 hypothetical protein D8872_09860 [Streptococcus cristatus]
MNKFMAKIKSDNSDTKILKIIRDFSHEPIGAIKEKMTHHMAVLETEYLNLERLKSFKKTVEEIIELGGELQLFLDDEKVTMQFLSHVIESQEDTKNQIEEDDFYMFDDTEQ